MITLEFLTYAIYALGAINLILIFLVIYLTFKIKKILIGKNAKTLEDSIVNTDKSVKDLETFRKELESYLRGVESRLRKSVQGIETIRFNPFKGDGSGGNQSFATSFINENGDGVVLSSLYSRDRVSIFSKPIKNHKSEYELTKEEREAMNKSKEQASKK